MNQARTLFYGRKMNSETLVSKTLTQQFYPLLLPITPSSHKQTQTDTQSSV